MLIASALLAVLMGKMTDGLVVFSVVVINALIGFIQEYRSNQEIAALKKMVPDKAVVIRDGDPLTIDSAFIVPGDIVLLQSGSKVPADIRLFETRSCMIVEAALTGESLPSQKSVETIHKDAASCDRKTWHLTELVLPPEQQRSCGTNRREHRAWKDKCHAH